MIARASALAVTLASLTLAVAPALAEEGAPKGFVPPRLKHFVEATPPPALATRRQVDVVLIIDVDTEGRATSVVVAQAAGDGFDEAALEAARRFEFEPGRSDGQPVPVRITYRYRFAYKEPPPPAALVDSPPEVQSSPVAGVVLARGERVPLAGVTVIVDKGPFSVVTDAGGGFAFAALPIGEHVLHVRGDLAGEPDFPLTVKPGTKSVLTLYVDRGDRFRSTVKGHRPVQEVVEQTLTSEEVKRIPGTQGDTLKAVQNLPGVARPPFNGGLLVVWGSAPQDSRTYVDGVYIPLLYHFSGLRSTVNAELIAGLTFLGGGYGADYGRGLGGVVEAEGRRPREDGYHGFAQIDLIDVSALVEGPITKRLSFAAAARVSWLHLFLPAFTTASAQASPQYWDYQARLRYRLSPRDDLELFAFGSDDTLKLLLTDANPALDMRFDTHMFYHRALLKYLHRFEQGATLTVIPSVGYDMPYNVKFTYGTAPFSTDYGQWSWTLRAVARVPINRWLRVDAGLDFEGTRFTMNATQNIGGMIRDGDNGGFGGLGGPDTAIPVASDRLVLYGNHVAPYARAELSLLDRRIVVAGQLRLETMTFSGYPGEARAFQSAFFRPEPRLSLRVQLHSRLALTAAAGLYHQAPDPQDLSDTFGSTALRPQSAIHTVLGFEAELTPTLHVSLHGFWKQLSDLVVRGDGTTGAPLDNGGRGRVYGGQLLVRQELWKNFFGWLSYTISRSERQDHAAASPDAWRLFQYDQTHILTMLASYKLPRGFQLGARFRYATGNPFTPAQGAFYDVNSDGYVPLWAGVYAARMPAFHQLDLRLDKTFTFDRFRLLLYLDIENVYAASSAEAATWSYNYKQVGYVSGLPLLPVFGVRGEF